MKYNCLTNFYSFFYMFIFILLLFLIPIIDTCDVMGSRACGKKPDKDDQESDPVKYCVASRVYFECVHKKYRGCENKEKYEMAMESMMKGIRKRVDDLLAFCSDKIEDYKFNINWESPKKVQVSDSVRHGGSNSVSTSSKNGNLGSSDDTCQVKTINDLCQPLMIHVKFKSSWNNANKRSWCQQTSTYFRCLKSRLDKCPQQDVQNQFQQMEHYLHAQININCPGGVTGCTRSSNDARCHLGVNQSNTSSSTFSLAYFFLQSVLQILLLLLL